MKKLLLVLLIFISFDIFGQIRVKEGSFKKIEGYVERDRKMDINNRPMALIKISTENINAEERRKFTFKGNAATEFDAHLEPGEIYLYLSAASATFVEIIHDDYGKTEFPLPYDLCDYCGYELVIQYIPIDAFHTEHKSQNNFVTIDVDQKDAAIFIDGSYIGNGFVEVPLQINKEHAYRIECDLYYEETGKIMVTAGDPIEKNISMRPAHGFLNVDTKPEQGAMVYIDGKKVGTTPYKSGKLSSGTYKVKTLMAMYDPMEQTITITDGNTTQTTLNMSANFVNVTVNTDKDSDIYIDEEFKAKGTWSGRVSEGTHFFEAKKDKHRTQSKNISLVLGKDEIITIENPMPICGFLELRSNPTKADIYIDGKHIGQTPRVISDLLIGKHELRLQKQGCASLIKDIDIKEGETLSLNESLQTGREVTVKTDKVGDKIYVDDNYIGETPLTTNLSYGMHTVKAIRGGQVTTQHIDIKISGGETDFVLAFGKMININSDTMGDDVFVDGKKVGTTPVDIDFSLGKHEVEVRRGRLYESKTIDVGKPVHNKYYFTPRKEPLNKYLGRGVDFLTLNMAYSVAPQTSFGLTYGQVKKIGWFVSAMSNFGFRFDASPWNEMYDADEAVFSGESSKARLSLTGGFICKLFGPIYAKLGAGYGVRVKYWEVSDRWYVYSPDTYSGVDLTAGLMLNTNGLAISADVVTTNFKTMEVKLGIGLNWNGK